MCHHCRSSSIQSRTLLHAQYWHHHIHHIGCCCKSVVSFWIDSCREESITQFFWYDYCKVACLVHQLILNRESTKPRKFIFTPLFLFCFCFILYTITLLSMQNFTVKLESTFYSYRCEVESRHRCDDVITYKWLLLFRVLVSLALTFLKL